MILLSAQELVCLITSYEEKLFEDWTQSAENLTTENLERPLLVRDDLEGTLSVNFGHNLMSSLMEVKNLKKEFQTRQVPKAVAEVFKRFDEYRKNKNSLDQTVRMYNYLKLNTVREEYSLIEVDIETCDDRLRAAENQVNWNTRNIKDYLEELRLMTYKLESRVVSAQENVKKIKREINKWVDKPLFIRINDSKKEPLLNIGSREEMKSKRYKDIEKTSAIIQELIEENEELLKGDEVDFKYWNLYLRYIDEMVTDGLLKTIAVSLGYLLDQTDVKKNPSPLFSAEMELCEPNIIYKPSLDRKIHNNFYDLMVGLIDDIFNMAKLVPKVHKRKGASTDYLDTITEHPELSSLREQLIKRVEDVMDTANDKKSSYLDYSYLWMESRKDYLFYFLNYSRQLSQEELEKIKENEKSVKKVQPKLDQFQEQIDQYEAIHEEVRKIENVVVFQSWFRTDATSFKNALLNCIKKWSYIFKKHLLDHVVNSLSELNNFIDRADEALMTQVHEGDYDGLIKVMEFLSLVANRQKATDNMFEPLQEVIDVLRQYGMAIPNESMAQLDDLPEKWANTKRLSVTAKQQVLPLMGMEVGKLKTRIEDYDKFQKNYRNVYSCMRFFDYNCQTPYAGISKAQVKIDEFMKKIATLQAEAVLFEVTVPVFDDIVQCKKENKCLKELWDYIDLVRTSMDSWKKTKWADIDVEGMEMECKKFSKDIRALDKVMKNWSAFLGLESSVKNMLTSLRAIGELQNSAIRDRHWEQLVQVVRVRFVMSEETTFADLLKLNLHNFEDDVHNLVDKACKELAMEKMIKDLNSSWSTLEFSHDVHKRTGSTLLRTSEELIETLEENQVQLQNMMTSKFIGYFLEEISTWQKCLSMVDQVISLWMEVQRTWSHLESIFIGSEDIRNQLPADSERFDKINEEFQALMTKMAQTPNVVKATNVQRLPDQLENLQSQLSLCEKALAEYLETKRLAFPRFYFASSADLLDILSNGDQPQLVAKHLTKLFDSIAKITMEKVEDVETNNAIEMIAKDGEVVPFVAIKDGKPEPEPCPCKDQVEVWLNRLMKSMRESIRAEFSKAMSSYDHKPRESWLFDFPAQVSLAGTQISWTTEVSTAFNRLEEGYENALKDYYKKQIIMLNNLITLLLGSLSKGDRQKVMTICTIDVHSRDVVNKMIVSKIESSFSFMWQSQLRHRWDEKEEDCFANICDAQFRYWHEYLGNTPRLVITPLTDRCYITLTQSLHLIMGGAPQGPAGTGKTETTKDLGRAIGMMVYVFNCSEQMDYKSCGNIFKGLSQSGAWGCFDEFNRITVEVLSVIAVQVKCIQDGIKGKGETFDFMGEIIPMSATVGYFITMNPGYAGRAELPENLKVLFRPCAMCVPDLRLICEIMLVAEGFLDASALSRKFITLYNLCKELLSKQDHYDWGLRAVKSVLVVAGTLKRSDRDRPEEQVLMRALRDFNVPKIIYDDLPVFLGLISDLFPNLDVPRKRDPDFEKAVKTAACDLKLQPEENFIMKIVQLEEILFVRHSVFIIGDAGTGKTQTWKTLFRTYQNLKKKPTYTDLNPKAVTNDELYGIINPATREWKDGLFSCIMRDLANLAGDGPKWILLDGDIDPMWIESLNTVMDDNKILTLASNERIAVTPEMKLIFEISNLRTATPATVSRAGILYINPGDLGWNAYVTSWIETRENPSIKANLTILFDRYIPIMQDTISKRFKKITPIANISHTQVLCSLLDSLVVPSNIPPDSPKELFETYFVFALIWAYGSPLYNDGQTDFRNEFSKWFQMEFKALKFPSGMNVFDFWVDPFTNEYTSWSDKVPKFELDSDVPLQACLVHTSETIRIKYFVDILVNTKFPLMLVGLAGSGKTLMINEKLCHLDENYSVANVPFNFYYSAEMTQKILEKPLEKKAGKNYGPPGNKKLIYFLDDMNMPEVDEYGTVGPHTIIRQHMDYGHWYDRNKLTLKEIHNTQYIASMNPTAGSFTIDPRLQRHFATFSVVFPSADSLFTIYETILKDHLKNPTNKFNANVIKVCTNVVNATLALHAKCAQMFSPTAVKFHYIFNLRDLSNVFQGLLFSTNECVPMTEGFVRLWIHETNRVYRDKLADAKDIESYDKAMKEIQKKSFDEMNTEEVFAQPLIFCHFAKGIGEPKYMPIKGWDILSKTLSDALRGYNELNTVMDLVLFEDAMSHVCRINRILESPRGNALLIGVGGSGKQSLSRLAAYISSMEVFQITLRKGYGIPDLKIDMSNLYQKTGVKNLATAFLMSDAQVADEKFLVLINNLLASGEIPDLFSDDEVENIVSMVRNEVKGAGISDTRENCWKFFIDRVRKQLKVVLCFSPVGSTLRIRGRKFPALISCTSIDWFHEWPVDALMSVAEKFLANLPSIPEEIRPSIADFMAHVHQTVTEMSLHYKINDKRYNYTTPKSFLELINLYSKILCNKDKELTEKVQRLGNGLEKLRETGAQVDALKEQLAAQEVELAKKNQEADELIKIVGIETEKVTQEKATADQEKLKVDQINIDVGIKQKDCAADLKKAEPALLAAQEALNTLNKTNITELKSFGSPPAAVLMVTGAVMVLMEGQKGKIPKDRSWPKVKVMMAKVDKFLDDLINYDKENIHPNILTALQMYLNDTDFDPDFVRSKSGAAAGLCSWVINVVKFYEVYCDVEPKRRALEEANQQLRDAQERLQSIIDKVAELEKTLEDLTNQYTVAVEAKVKCQQEADATGATIALANRLVGGLASENVRWGDSVNSLKLQSQMLPGDVLLAGSFISYLGCFTKQYRVDLLEKKWLPHLKKVPKPIPMSLGYVGANVFSLLTDDAIIAGWNNEGLPSDAMSIENASILCNSVKWPLMIDPQLQGIKWIKNKYGKDLHIIRLGQKNYMDTVEKCVSSGSPILIENLPEDIDVALDPLLGRSLIKKGTAIKLGDKEIEYNHKFKLFLHTKMANPHYKPELQAQLTLINFTVTRTGLEDQLLAEVVKADRPDLEEQKAELTRQQNEYKILLKELEDDLLARLSSANSSTILSDYTLVENLEHTKKTASEVETKVEEAKKTSAEIDKAREFYRDAAARASVLYFILNDLNKINPMYQFSLKSFSVVFEGAIQRAVMDANVQIRVKNLIDSITFQVYQYTTRGLFECDKLIFTAQMAFQILLMNEEINSTELDFLLRFPTTPNCTSPIEFISNVGWGAIKMLSQMEEFRNLDRDIENNQKRWLKFVEGEAPEKDKFPQDWKKKDALQRLCMMRALRPDRMIYAVQEFVKEKLGSRYISNKSVPFEESYQESGPTTPIFFILSPGVDPLKDVEALGKNMGFSIANKNFHNISLGQGQEVLAEDAMSKASLEGHWVVLQNIHLVKSWLPSLEKKIEELSEGAHSKYRLYLSADPASNPANHIIPQSILETSIKITNEPPTGIFANVHKALDNFNQETLESCSKEAEFKSILFSLCYFHAVVSERGKFGPQGWNKLYPFNTGDLIISTNVLYNYLEANNRVPWEDLRYLFGEIMYGGHITDDWDRRLCKVYLEEYMHPDQLDGELMLAPGFCTPPNTDYNGYHNYINNNLPPESPHLYGLHPNAEIGFLTATSEKMFKTVFELQPRESGGDNAQASSRYIYFLFICSFK